MSISRKKSIKIFLLILSIIIVFLAPYGYHIHIIPGPDSVPAMLWEYSSYYSFRFITPLLYYIQFYIFRLVVLFFIIKFLQERILRKIVFVMGIIGELIPLILSIPGFLIRNSEGENIFPIIIPIPILLIFIIFLIYLVPNGQEKVQINKTSEDS